MKVNILGTMYDFFLVDGNDSDMTDCDGKCYSFDKCIKVKKKKDVAGDTEEGKDYYFNKIILHELVHAFGEESGTSYDDDEALTDWIARMIPKINSARDEIIARLETVNDNTES